MPKNSSYIDVAAQLTTLITAALPGVQVIRGVQLDRLRSSHILVGGLESGDHEIPTMKAGRKRRQETYLLNVSIVSVKKGPDVIEAETDAFAMFDALEDILAEDPAIGIGTTPDYVGLVCEMNEFSLDTVYDQERTGFRAMINAKVLVRVRLQ